MGFALTGCWCREAVMFYVYVLQSEVDEGLYIGFTGDLKRRLAEHQEGVSFSTSYRRPWRRAEASGWSTRLACCLRRLAADTRRACVCERHADLKTHRFGNPVCFLRRRAVFPATRRKPHASRVLHPRVAVARQRNLDASGMGLMAYPVC